MTKHSTGPELFLDLWAKGKRKLKTQHGGMFCARGTNRMQWNIRAGGQEGSVKKEFSVQRLIGLSQIEQFIDERGNDPFL